MTGPMLHRADMRLAWVGPFGPAQRYWRGNDPEYDVVAPSVDGRRMLVGEVTWPAKTVAGSKAGPHVDPRTVPGAATADTVRARFVPDGTGVGIDAEVVDARTAMAVLR